MISLPKKAFIIQNNYFICSYLFCLQAFLCLSYALIVDRLVIMTL